MINYFKNRRNYILEIIFDIFIFGFSYYFAFYLRLDGQIDMDTQSLIRSSLPIVIIIRTLTFFALNVFNGQWRYCSIADLISIIKAITCSTVFIGMFIFLINQFNQFPRSVLILDWMIVTLMIGGVRFARRLFNELLISKKNTSKKVLIVGAGRVGKSLVNEMKMNLEFGYNPVAMVDDDKKKHHQSFYGVKVLGTRMSIPHIVATMEIDEIVIALPHVSGKDIREIVKLCRVTKKPFKIIKNIKDPTDLKDLKNRIRNIKIEDLIGRRAIETDLKEIEEFIFNKRVLVTGAAGSIGSELCRQIAQFDPEKLIALDRSENGLFYLERELTDKYPELDYSLALADINDIEDIEDVFSKYKPHFIFHAAAYKHVPMMEMHPQQAIKNNVLGTKNVMDAARQNGVEKFVLISTDKAVNPMNIMGISKRIAEQYIQASNQLGETKALAVRFGNVFGSSGSVIRLFEEQISKGGPVTVTHPDVARFFMTIPEAVQLVLQAATKGTGGEIFILKMGDLVKIYDIAKELIILAGKEPNTDIKISFTGLRPGEKVVEELWEDAEECKEEFNENLYVVRNGHIKDIDSYNLDILKIKECKIVPSNPNSIRSKLESVIYSSQ